MIEISPNHEHVTVINVFRVKDDAQEAALERLMAVNARIAREPGWISASVHRSFDGTRVANYAQWHTAADIVAALRHPELAPLLARLAEVGEGDWHLYDVVTAHEADGTVGCGDSGALGPHARVGTQARRSDD